MVALLRRRRYYLQKHYQRHTTRRDGTAVVAPYASPVSRLTQSFEHPHQITDNLSAPQGCRYNANPAHHTYNDRIDSLRIVYAFILHFFWQRLR
jgi:hypothetical protein